MGKFAVLCVNDLCYILIISIIPIFIFNFLIFIHFTNQITLKPRLARKLKLQFKFSTTKGQINVLLWAHMGHDWKGWKNFHKVLCHFFKILR